jgi:hypothetical protein
MSDRAAAFALHQESIADLCRNGIDYPERVRQRARSNDANDILRRFDNVHHTVVFTDQRQFSMQRGESNQFLLLYQGTTVTLLFRDRTGRSLCRRDHTFNADRACQTITGQLAQRACDN